MKALSRRSVLATALATPAAAMPLVAGRAARAQEVYPTRPVTVLVPAAPGGTTDFTARALAEGLTQELGQQFVVDNKGGANGNIGMTQVTRAEPDGYTLLLSYSGYHVTNPFLQKQLRWDPVESFAPIALAVKAPHLFAVRKDLPVNSLAEFIDYAKAHPGEINYGSPGVGSIPHIGTELFQQMTGTEMVHVPYKGTGPAMTDLLGGSIDLSLTTPPSAAGHLRTGGIKGLALAGSQRHPMLPDIPTAAEAGTPFTLEAWFALYAPAGTPQPVIDALAEAARKVVSGAHFKAQAEEQGTYAVYMGPKELAEFTKAELAYWGEAIRKAGISLEG